MANHIKWYFLPVLILAAFLFFWELDNVDLEASEDIYVSDSVGYMRGDPFMVPRHHLRKPHYPASPHPFLTQLLQAEVLKQFGLSLYSARTLQAGAGFATFLAVTYLAYLMFKTWGLAVFAGLVFITIPLVVRFGRMAVLDPLLMFWQVLGMVWAWMYLGSRGKWSITYASLMALSWVLASSTKLSGVFFSLPLALIIIWKYFKISRRHIWLSIGVLLITAMIFFVLLNDPQSYIQAWFNFSDPKHRNISLFSSIKGVVAFKYWYIFVTSLIGIGPFLIAIFGVIRYRRFWLNTRRWFIAMWLLGGASYLILNPPHVTGLSAEWSYLPLMAPLAIAIGKILMGFSDLFSHKKRYRFIVVLGVIYLIIAAPPVILYGLRFRQLPLAAYLKARNVIRGDLAVTKIIHELNLEKRKALILVDLKSVGFPLWLLNSNLQTEPFYHQLPSYNYVVTDNVKLIQTTLAHGFQVRAREWNPTERELYLLKNPAF